MGRLGRERGGLGFSGAGEQAASQESGLLGGSRQGEPQQTAFPILLLPRQCATLAALTNRRSLGVREVSVPPATSWVWGCCAPHFRSTWPRQNRCQLHKFAASLRST